MMQKAKVFIILACLFLTACSTYKSIGTTDEIRASVNSTEWQTTENEINRLCIDACGEMNYRGYDCPCNHCECECR